MDFQVKLQLIYVANLYQKSSVTKTFDEAKDIGPLIIGNLLPAFPSPPPPWEKLLPESFIY